VKKRCNIQTIIILSRVARHYCALILLKKLFKCNVKLVISENKKIRAEKMRCNHENCGDREKIWLTFKYNGRERGLKPHLYCAKCGLIKNGSSDKPRRMGYYINKITVIGKEIKITKVQMRLVSIELEKRGIDDAYGMNSHDQEEIFIEVLRHYVNVSEQIIRRFL
jgi:hypothetical protein